MNSAVPVTEDIFFIGVNDRETDLFEAMWPLPNGVSYNSYIIVDDKVALIDTVKKGFLTGYLAKVRELLKEGKTVDYLIINHMEPDHSGAIQVISQMFPEMQVVGNKKTMELLSGYYGITDNVKVIQDGEVLDLGKHKLKFYLTPMVHWPETMMTYDENDKVLFSGDAFGGFGTLDGGIFDDEVEVSYYENEILRYFSNIIGKFSQMVQNALKKLQGLDIAVIASTHGPIWRKDPGYIIGKYDAWSRHEAEPGAVVCYGSMYTNTQRMAEAVARGLAEEGVCKIKVHNASRSHLSYMITDAWRYKGIILGSCTYDVGLFPPMRHLTQFLQSKLMKNRDLGIFGSYGWSGGAVKQLREFAEKTKWNLVEPVVEARCAPGEDALEQCHTLGRTIAKGLLCE